MAFFPHVVAVHVELQGLVLNYGSVKLSLDCPLVFEDSWHGVQDIIPILEELFQVPGFGVRLYNDLSQVFVAEGLL